ncbi:MAG: TIGR00159 family protein [Chloroflexi bacterium]|nr:TIGR00159 family protein [Chloroflexota bacterium]
MGFSLEQITFYLSTMTEPGSLVDILLVTLVIYGLMQLIKGTRAIQVLRGFLIVVALLWAVVVSTPLRLPAFSWLIDKTLPALFLSIPVIFQPELRRALERVGGASGFWRVWRQRQKEVSPMIKAVVAACRRLSQRRHGALIVFEQETGLQEYIDTGVRLNADPSLELFLTIFDKHTELHDGAIIVRAERIAAAACVMPLSASNLSDRQLGLRHRASLGISEVSDAVALVVSEETGQIAIAHNGRILRRQDLDQLEQILQTFLQKKITPPPSRKSLQGLPDHEGFFYFPCTSPVTTSPKVWQ